MILSSWFRFQCPEWPGGEKIQKENLQQVQSQKRIATRRKKFTLFIVNLAVYRLEAHFV